MHSRFSRFPMHDARNERGSALVEFAVTLPLLVVFLVGIYDFSGAFTQKQKIEQAAQEGAIVAGAQPMNDIYINPQNPNPDSLQPVVTAIFNSLVGANVLPQGNQSPCVPTGTVTLNGGVSWTYTISGCPDNLIITINRGWTGSGTPAGVGTQVTVRYPYRWRFNSAIQLIMPGAQYAATTNLTETATVHNQT
jgi:Flp pilus assembly protein TadG